MSSYNKEELDLLQSEGEGVPKEIVKTLAENKFAHQKLITIPVISSIIGLEFSKSVLEKNP